jgi:precorrin-6B methylase 2
LATAVEKIGSKTLRASEYVSKLDRSLATTPGDAGAGTGSVAVNLMTAVNMALDRAMTENERYASRMSGLTSAMVRDLAVT